MGVGESGEVVKAFLQLANFTLGPDATPNTEIHKQIGSHKGSQLSQCIQIYGCYLELLKTQRRCFSWAKLGCIQKSKAMFLP